MSHLNVLRGRPLRRPEGHLGWRELQQRRIGARDRPRLQSFAPARTTQAVLLLALLSATLFTTVSFLQHDSFRTNAFDLGNLDQAVWNTSQGRPFRFTNWEGGSSRLAAHVEPILLLLAPLYQIWSAPKLLLLLQSVVVALGALPAAWLAWDRLGSEVAAVAFAAAYLFAPGLGAANLADFHPVTLAAPLLLFAIFALNRGWALPFLLAVGLAMATKEQVPFTVLLLGVYAWLQGRRRLGGLTVALAVVWLLVALGWVLPAHNAGRLSPYLERYQHFGETPGEALRTLLREPAALLRLVTEPARVAYLYQLLMAVAFLPLLSPATFLLASPDLLLNVLSTVPDQYGFQAHYSAGIAALLVGSAIMGAAEMRRWLEALGPRWALRGTAVLALAVLLLCLLGALRLLWLPLLDHPPKVTEHHRRAEAILARIPAGAAVSATSGLNPHLSQRERLYLFPRLEDADYVALDITGTPYPLDVPSLHWKAQELLKGEWGVRAAEDGYLLLQRGLAGKEIPPEFYSFLQARAAPPPVVTDVRFGQALRLLGYEVEPAPARGRAPILHGPDPYARLTLYLQAERAPLPEGHILVELRAPGGQSDYRQWATPATQWYPLPLWKQGEVVRVTVDRLPLGDLSEGQVLLGVAGQHPEQVHDRWAVEAPADLALADEGTLFPLLTLRRG